jgi:hypothetical protein
MKIKGMGSSLTVKGSGTLTWLIVDDCGTDVHLTVHNAIYVPECLVCLLSPKQVVQQTKNPGDGFNVQADSGILQIGGYHRTIQYKQKSNSLYSTHTENSGIQLPTYPLRTQNLHGNPHTQYRNCTHSTKK